MLDLIIRNGWIVDGTGEKKAWRGEVGVKDGKIAAVAEHIDDDAAQVLDAKGHIIAPGFLDVHRHTDVVVLHDDYGEIELRQGITTVVGGQCGLSIVPSVQRGNVPFPSADRRHDLDGLRFQHF